MSNKPQPKQSKPSEPQPKVKPQPPAAAKEKPAQKQALANFDGYAQFSEGPVKKK